jgi:hypothetical protein
LNYTYHYVRPFPLIIQVVDVVFTAVAIPLPARVREPVVPAPAKYIVSVVIAIVVVIDGAEIKVIVVPIGRARLAFELIVTVRLLEEYRCLPASAATIVYEPVVVAFCGMPI